jgi:hypothetical protein
MINLNIPGQMTELELRALEEISKTVPHNGIIVEVGSLYGLSSFTWSTSVHTSAKVYCIDPWVREPWIIDLVETKSPHVPTFSFEAFSHYTAGLKNITAIKGYSPVVVKDWSKPIDVYFDDAMHHNPILRANLRFWLDKVKPGGIICGHDYCEEWPDVIKEAKLIARELGAEIRVVGTVWAIQIPCPIPNLFLRKIRKCLKIKVRVYQCGLNPERILK